MEIPLQQDELTTTIRENCHDLQCISVRNDGCVSIEGGPWLDSESEFTHETRDKNYVVYKTLNPEGDGFSLIIHDKRRECRYVFSYWKEINLLEQLYLHSDNLKPIEEKFSRMSPLAFLIAFSKLILMFLLLYCVFYYHEDVLQFIEPLEILFTYPLIWIVASAVLFCCTSALGFAALFPFIYGLALFIELIFGESLEGTDKSFNTTIGPFRFRGDGKVEVHGVSRYSFNHKFQTVEVDGYRLQFCSHKKVRISYGHAQAFIEWNHKQGIVVFADEKIVGIPGFLATPYCHRNPFCFFEPSQPVAGYEFASRSTRVGTIHHGFHGPPRTNSFERGGVEFDAGGNIQFADANVPNHSTLSQTKMKNVLIAKVPTKSGRKIVRIVQLEDDNVWFYKFVDSNSDDEWKQLHLQGYA